MLATVGYSSASTSSCANAWLNSVTSCWRSVNRACCSSIADVGAGPHTHADKGIVFIEMPGEHFAVMVPDLAHNDRAFDKHLVAAVEYR